MKNTLLLMVLVLIIGPCSFAQQKNLWATATVGGANGYGTILKGDSSGSNFTVVHSFDQTNGSYPIGKMAVAPNGVLYCVTELGGIDDSCTVCTYDPATDSFAMIHQFFANVSTGGVPYSGVITAYNGLIYGTTTQGGAYYDSVTGMYGGGVIYSIDPATNVYTDVFDFPDTNGYGPTSELLQGADKKLYGIVLSANYTVGDSAYLFSFDPATSQFMRLGKLLPSQALGTPSPALVQGPDTKLYGVLQNITTYDSLSYNTTPGILFSYDISSSSIDILHTFDTFQGMPTGGLLVANGNIYGETSGTGSNNKNGIIYSYNIAGSSFSSLAGFDSSTGVTPIGGLGLLGNNLLTGSAEAGGAWGYGTLFTFNLTTNTFGKLMDFDYGTMGAYPMCNITESGFTTTGIKTPAVETGVAVTPNITSSSTNVHVSNIESANALRFSVYDLTGQLLLNTQLQDNTTAIDCGNLANAVYIWRVLDENESILATGKLVKQ